MTFIPPKDPSFPSLTGPHWHLRRKATPPPSSSCTSSRPKTPMKISLNNLYMEGYRVRCIYWGYPRPTNSGKSRFIGGPSYKWTDYYFTVSGWGYPQCIYLFIIFKKSWKISSKNMKNLFFFPMVFSGAKYEFYMGKSTKWKPLRHENSPSKTVHPIISSPVHPLSRIHS